MKYEVTGFLNEEFVKFIVSVPENTTKYQVYLMIIGKYKEKVILNGLIDIVPVIELDFN